MFNYISNLPFILASSSPRRKELLESLEIQFSILSPDCDESVLEGEDPAAMVKRLSRDKAMNVSLKESAAWILAADTTVYCENKILGKPSDPKEAFEMLSLISGGWHQVWGGVTLYNSESKFIFTEACCTEVLMRNLQAEEISRFVKTGEPMDKAGAYAIQGIGAGLVSEIKGSYTNVVGLNLSAVIEVLLSNSIIK